MWCYQNPGFETLLLGELQKQQQCSQFCDTLLKAEGVSVPAHSCVVSALSPQISSALTAMPVPPAGQSRLLEFQTVGARTLLHMVRLLYSGEMAGEGEKEKQEAIMAAAKLGISGLVEVTKRDFRSRNEGGQHIEVGVQSEPHMLEKSGVRQGRWRREVRDGSTFLWKEILSDGQKDTSTQTEVLETKAALPTHPTAFLKSIDESASHSFGQTDSHFASPQIPYVPISLVYQSDENETAHPSSHPAASVQNSTSAGQTHVGVVTTPHSSVLPSFHLFSNEVTPCAADAQGQLTGSPGPERNVVDSENWEDKWLEQFQGNISEFISHFLNTDGEEGYCSMQAAGRQVAQTKQTKGARSSRKSTRPPRRPQNRTGGRRRGRLTEIVDVQDVGVSKLQKMFLQRGGVRPSRLGQGGGTVGRKLYMINREHMKPARRYQRRRRCGEEWEFSQSGDVLLFTKKHCRQTNTNKKFNQDISSAGRAQSAKAKPTTSFSPPSSPPVPFYNLQTLSSSSHSFQPSLCPTLLSTVAGYTSSAPSLLHTTCLPPPAPPTQEGHPEHIDCLLEDVMMGLDILTSDNTGSHSEPADVNSSITSSCNILTQDKQNRSTDLLEAFSAIHGSTPVGTLTGSSGSSTLNQEVPVLQEKGELTDVLDHFLQSFDQHIYNYNAREKKELSCGSCAKAGQPYIVLSKHSKTNSKAITCHTSHQKDTCKLQPARHTQTATRQQSHKGNIQSSRSQTRKTAVHPKHAARQSSKTTSASTQWKTNQYMLSLERKKKNPVSLTDRKPRIFSDPEKQLQQTPVVRLERSGPLPLKAKLYECCQIQEVKNPTKTKMSSTLEKFPHKRKQTKWCCTKTYPIRSRLKETKKDCFLEEPFLHSPGCRQVRLRKNKQLPSSSDDESVRPQIQLQPVEPCGMEEQPENRNGGEPLTVQPQGETGGPPRKGQKRRAGSEEELGDDATVVKKVFIEPTAQPNTDTSITSSDSAECVSEAANVEVEDIIDVETVSPPRAEDCLQGVEESKKKVWSEIKENFRETKDNLLEDEMQRDSDEMIDVDEESDGITDLEKERDNCKEWAENGSSQSKPAAALPLCVSPLSRSAKQAHLRSTGSWEDEDIDVIGGSSPLPYPVMIS